MLFVCSWLGRTWLTVLPTVSLLPRWPRQKLMQKEVEYVSISRDTTESDLKQRREILDGTAKYIHQVCVCASILLLSKLYSCLHLFVPFGFCTNHCPLLPSSLPSPPSPPPPLASPFLLQSAVKAALEGRLLILEGIEKAERNVLPVLNNLLENREMQLEDGRFLVAPERYDKLAKVLYTQRAFFLVSPCMSKSSNSGHVRISRDCPTYLCCSLCCI